MAALDVTAEFVNEHDATIVAAIHAWVLGDSSGEATCSQLVGGALSPYEGMLEHRAEMATTDPLAPMVSENVTLGTAFVYLEASNYHGEAELAGCSEVDIVQPTTSVIVRLGKARVYDCTDPDTKEQAPCDDGEICTVGERCKNGTCQGGSPRSCAHMATDGCAAANCVNGQGCATTALADNTPCDDGLQCTDGDVCAAGKCVGTARDCVAGAPECQIALGCDESSGACRYDDAPTDTPCDDGLFCTVNDKCTAYGQCHSYETNDCATFASPCQLAYCDESTDQCVAEPEYNGHSCTDNNACTTGDHCDGIGACISTPKNCDAYADQCNTGACVDTSTGQCEKVPVAVGTPCTDYNPSTVNDKCNASGVCVGSAPDAGVPDTGAMDAGSDA